MVMFTPSYTLMQASKLGRGEGGDRSIPARIVWDSHQGGGGGGGGVGTCWLADWATLKSRTSLQGTLEERPDHNMMVAHTCENMYI